MSQAKIRFTYRDYKNLPESETKRYELLERELIMVPSPTHHQRISANLQYTLQGFVRKDDLGFIYGASCDSPQRWQSGTEPASVLRSSIWG